MQVVYSSTASGSISVIIKGANVGNYEDLEAKTQLLEACKDNDGNKSFALIKELVKNGANVDEIGGKGYTPLLFSLFNGSTKTAIFLLENGANPNLSNEDGWSPLMMACEKLENDLDTIKKLINCGADIHQKSHKGCTALMSACIYQKNANIISYLIEKGADVNVEDFMGWTALNFVCLHGNKYKALALLKAGAAIDHVDKYGQTLTYIARSHPDVLKLLREYGKKTSKK